MSESIRSVSQLTSEVVTEVEQVIVGKQELLREIMTAILADGHILLEDFPGLAKTLTAQSFAVALGLDFKRIQFTPDLLPGDITGSYVYDRNSGSFELRRGPIFANIVLADEINRASPKTQSALLEAMSQGQVTLEGETMPLPSPFIVIATQNPIEYEGTFPLPEAQLDRFLVKLAVGYPTVDEEQEILKRRRQRRSDQMTVRPTTDAATLLKMRDAVEDVHIDTDLERYIVELVHQTRVDSRVAVGASPRGSLALLKLARAYAAINGRDYVLPDDVKRFAKPVLLHRLILNPELWLRRNAPDQVLSGIINNVPVPVIKGD
jgi:MoxR-like ATPase